MNRLRLLCFLCFSLITLSARAQDASLFASIVPITPENAYQIQVLHTVSLGSPQALNWSPDSNLLAISTAMGGWIYHQSGTEWIGEQIQGHEAAPYVSFSPHGDVFLTSDCTTWHCPGQQNYLHEIAPPMRSISLPISDLGPFDFSDDGELLAASSSDRALIQIWQLDALLQSSPENSDAAMVCTVEVPSSTTADVLISPDGTQFAYSIGFTWDETVLPSFAIVVWDLQRCEQQFVLSGHSDFGIIDAFSADGTYILTSQLVYDLPKTYFLWETDRQAVITTFEGEFAQFSPDAAKLLVIGEQSQLYDLETGSTSMLPDQVTLGRYLLSGTLLLANADGEIHIVDPVGEERQLTGNGYAISTLQISQDESLVVTIDELHHVTLWDIPGGQRLFEFSLNVSPSSVPIVRLSADGKHLAWADDDGITIWDVSTAQSFELPDFRDYGHALYVTQTGNMLITFSYSSWIYAPRQTRVDGWEISNEGIHHRYTTEPQTTLFINDAVIIGVSEQGLDLRDTATGLLLSTIPISGGCSAAVASADGRYVACVTPRDALDERTLLFSVSSGEQLFETRSRSQTVFDTAHETVAIGYELWDIPARTRIDAYDLSHSLADQVAFNREGEMLGVGQNRVVNLTTGEVIAEMDSLIAEYEESTCAALDIACESGETIIRYPILYEPYTTLLSPDQRTLVSVGETEAFLSKDALRFWSIETNQSISYAEFGQVDLLFLEFSPNGALLGVYTDDFLQGGSQSLNRWLRLYDSASGSLLTTISSFRYPPQSIAFTPDNRLLFVSSDGIRVWGVVANSLLAP